jgi:hypothetical protein
LEAEAPVAGVEYRVWASASRSVIFEAEEAVARISSLAQL